MRARTVLQYLRDNPKFLRTHQSELTRMLRLAERDVVDLTGKQLVVLRDENTILRRQLGVWYQNAADNEQIMFFLHRLAVKLAGQPSSAGSIAKHLAALLKKHLQIPLCRLVPLTGDDRVELSSNDRRRLVDCAGALRSITPLASFAGLVGTKKWKAWLHVPVLYRRKLIACILCASADAKQFPRTAHSDYAICMAEIVAQALSRE